MKKYFFITSLLIVTFLEVEAQKKNYFSFESGSYFGNTNKNIVSGMAQSGFDDSYITKRESTWSSILNFFNSDIPIDYITNNHQYPVDWEDNDKFKFRIRAGHFFNPNTAIEAGFSRNYYGSVTGFDRKPSGANNNYLDRNSIANFLEIDSRVNTLYFACIKNNNASTLGVGAGPAFSLYKLTSQYTFIDGLSTTYNIKTKNYILPGGMVTGFWNFLSKKSWFVGIRTEMSFTIPLKIQEMKITNSSDPSFVSTFKSVKAETVYKSVTLSAGIRF
jgi:hypothetical protein